MGSASWSLQKWDKIKQLYVLRKNLLYFTKGLGKKNRKSSVSTPSKTKDKNTPAKTKAGEQDDARSSTGSIDDGAETRTDKLEPELEESIQHGSTSEKDPNDDSEEDDDKDASCEPPVGLLIDFGSPQRTCSDRHNEKPSKDGTTHVPAKVEMPKQNGSSKAGGNLTGDAHKDSKESASECRKGIGDARSQPTTKTKETVSPLVQERKFNFAVEAYRPDFAQHSVEGAGNPKMYGQSNAYRPWLHNDYPNSDSDDDDDEDGDDSSRQDCQSNGGTTPNKTSQSIAYNPFPTRRLKSEKDRTRSRLKVGLYKTADKNSGGNSGNNRCINQQHGSNSRSVKTGGRF